MESSKLALTYVAGRAGGITATWINGKGQYKKINQGTNDPQFKVLTLTISEPDGFESLNLLTEEHSYLKMCAYRDGLLKATPPDTPSGTATSSRP